MRTSELSILISEDEPDVARHLAGMLCDLGHRVVGIAEDGPTAVELAFELNPDLVIMDINLPKMDGLSAAREILGRFSVPVIISTGRTDNEVLEQVGDLNVQAWLSKPFSPAQLKTTLAIALTQYQMHDQARQKIAALKGEAGGTELPADRLATIGLTRRESEILHWISMGKSNGDIAAVLESSPRTVAKHIEHIFIKFAVDSRIAAVTEAHRRLRESGA